MRRAIREIAWIACAALLVAGPAAGTGTWTIGGQDSLSSYTYSAGGGSVLSFGATPGTLDDSGGINGLTTDAEVWFNAELSPKRFNGTTDFVPESTALDGRVTRGNFIKSASDNTLVIVDNTGAIPDVLLVFDIMVSLADMDGTGNLPQGGVKVGGASVPSGPDTDGFLFIGNLDSDCVALCRNEVELVGGSLANEVGGIGTIAHLHVRMDSLNPTLSNLNGYFGADFTSGNGPTPNPTVWDLTIVSMPEPGTGALLGFALAALAATRRSRRR